MFYRSCQTYLFSLYDKIKNWLLKRYNALKLSEYNQSYLYMLSWLRIILSINEEHVQIVFKFDSVQFM